MYMNWPCKHYCILLVIVRRENFIWAVAIRQVRNTAHQKQNVNGMSCLLNCLAFIELHLLRWIKLELLFFLCLLRFISFDCALYFNPALIYCRIFVQNENIKRSERMMLSAICRLPSGYTSTIFCMVWTGILHKEIYNLTFSIGRYCWLVAVCACARVCVCALIYNLVSIFPLPNHTS